MKKSILMSMLLLVGMNLFAQQAVITFKEKEHNFGQIEEAGGKVTTVFEFKNEGMTPLVLSNVRASCGCTTPKWPREPIEPGQTGTITVTYNPSGRPGRFQKTITITSNATTPTVKLIIKGEVLPKQVNPADKYPVKIGALNVNKNSLSYGIIMDDDSKIQSIEYANLTNEPITVEVFVDEKDKCIIPAVSLEKVEPKQTGKITIKFDGKECKEYGTVVRNIYVIVNGKHIISNDYKITINAIIRENFSKLTAEQKQQAPIIELPTQKVDFGTIKAGEKVTQKINIKNAGVNPLILRKLTCKNADYMAIKVAKTAIKGGKSTLLTLTLNTTDVKPGAYTRQIEVISNDPSHSRQFITLTWKVE